MTTEADKLKQAIEQQKEAQRKAKAVAVALRSGDVSERSTTL